MNRKKEVGRRKKGKEEMSEWVDGWMGG